MYPARTTYGMPPHQSAGIPKRAVSPQRWYQKGDIHFCHGPPGCRRTLGLTWQRRAGGGAVARTLLDERPRARGPPHRSMSCPVRLGRQRRPSARPPSADSASVRCDHSVWPGFGLDIFSRHLLKLNKDSISIGVRCGQTVQSKIRRIENSHSSATASALMKS